MKHILGNRVILGSTIAAAFLLVAPPAPAAPATRTLANLQAAFNGESNAKAR